MISKLFCILGLHDWSMVFPITETTEMHGKEYLLIKGERCRRCGKYSNGSLFFIRDAEAKDRPLMMTKNGFVELDENGEVAVTC